MSNEDIEVTREPIKICPISLVTGDMNELRSDIRESGRVRNSKNLFLHRRLITKNREKLAE